MNKVLAVIFVAAAVGAAGAFAAEDRAPRAGACAPDAAKFCKDVKPGEGRVKACLAEHKKELSEACAARVERKEGGKGKKGVARGKRGGGAGACAADAKTLCGEVKPGEGRVKACLRENLDKLSEGCKARQQKWLEKNKEEKKKA